MSVIRNSFHICRQYFKPTYKSRYSLSSAPVPALLVIPSFSNFLFAKKEERRKLQKMPFGFDLSVSLTKTDVAVCVAALASYGALYAWKSRNNSKRLPHPPGPPGLPLIGNLRDLPSQPSWIEYLRMGEKYSEFLCTVLISRAYVNVLRDWSLQIRISSVSVC